MVLFSFLKFHSHRGFSPVTTQVLYSGGTVSTVCPGVTGSDTPVGKALKRFPDCRKLFPTGLKPRCERDLKDGPGAVTSLLSCNVTVIRAIPESREASPSGRAASVHTNLTS